MEIRKARLPHKGRGRGRDGCSDSALSFYFGGGRFPTLPICEKFYGLTKIPSLEPHKAAEAIRQLHNERLRKIHTPEVLAKISEALRKNWADPQSRTRGIVKWVNRSERPRLYSAIRISRLHSTSTRTRIRSRRGARWTKSPRFCSQMFAKPRRRKRRGKLTS